MTTTLKQIDLLKISRIIVLLLCSSLIINIQANTLVIVRGAANCGKTSLCKALNTLDSSYKIISQDEIDRKITYKICEHIFPTQMAIIHKAIKYENIWHAIRCLNIIFIQEMNKEETECVMKAIEDIRRFFNDPAHKNQLKVARTIVKQSVIKQLLFYTACGYNIILDSWENTDWNHELNQLKECFGHIIDVVAYCSLETIQKRWKKRHDDAIKTENYTEKRFICQLLSSFFRFFELPSTNANGLLTITKKDFDTLIQYAARHIRSIKQNGYERFTTFSYREFTLKELVDFKERMYAKFNFENVHQITLAPQIPYDILLSTEGDCDDYARTLLENIKIIVHNVNENKIN